MPKNRKTKRSARPTESASSTRVKPWVRWVAMAIVFALGISVLAGALTAQAEPLAHKSDTGLISALAVADEFATGEANCLLDNDSDGVANPDDPDVDGDGIVNGEDSDIDGDSIDNSKDGDPVATNCNDDAGPPLLGTTYTAGEDPFDWTPVVFFSAIGGLVAGIAVFLILRRKKKSTETSNGVSE